MTMELNWNGANTKDVPASLTAAIKAGTRAVPIPLVAGSDKL
jgi:hypothetical protein